MNTSKNKKKLIIFLVSGLVFASTLAGFDYMEGTQFNIGKFILFFVGFGGFMSLVIIRKPQTLELKDIVRETFYTIMDAYNAELKNITENNVQVIAENFLIDVKWHFGEVFVSIKESEVDEGIEPLLWGYFTSQLDYKNVLPPSYPPEMLLGEIAKNSLFIECICIRLFCKNLLDGDFSRKLEFYNRKESILVEINEFFTKKYKDN